MKPIRFTGKITKVMNWAVVKIPLDTKNIFGTRGHILVDCLFDGVEVKSTSLMPAGEGEHFVTVKAAVRKATGKKVGDKITVEIKPGTPRPPLRIPAVLSEALEASDVAQAFFEKLSQSHKRAFVNYIAEAKTRETSEKRAVQSVLKMEKLFAEKKQRQALKKKSQ